MHIVHVYIQVKEECIDAFKEASLENARNSILEKGVHRFDVVVQQDNPARFALLEEYYSPEDQQKHRETEHFKKWKAGTADMLEGEYSRMLYHSVEQ